MALAMKAMKAAKVMKAAKAMKAMKVSKIATGKLSKLLVFRGSMEKTVGGLTKDKLVKNRHGKVVSKAPSARAKKSYAQSPLKKFSDACKQAKKELGITGFCAVNGKTAQGRALYAKVKTAQGKAL